MRFKEQLQQMYQLIQMSVMILYPSKNFMCMVSLLDLNGNVLNLLVDGYYYENSAFFDLLQQQLMLGMNYLISNGLQMENDFL